MASGVSPVSVTMSLSPVSSVVVVVLGLGLLLPVFADQWQDSAGYPSATSWSSPVQPTYQPSAYQPSYPTVGGSGSGCAGGGLGGSLGGSLGDIASYKTGLLQTTASAAIAALMAKLPALIFLKVFIFKLIVVPMLFLFAAIPLLTPLLMLLTPMWMNMMHMMSGDSTTTTTAAPASRARAARSVDQVDEVMGRLLGSQMCLERVACTLGVRDKQSPYRKPLVWLLKQLQGMVPSGLRDRVKAYRQAYMTGGARGLCDPQELPCETPQLLVQQEGRTFRIF